MSTLSTHLEQIFHGVTQFHQTEDLQALNQVNRGAVTTRFCCGTSIKANRLAETIHTYFGSDRIRLDGFFAKKSVRELTHFKNGLEDIQHLRGMSSESSKMLGTAIAKIEEAIAAKSSQSETVAAVAVGTSRRRRRKSRKKPEEKQSLLAHDQLRRSYTTRRTPSASTRVKPAAPKPKGGSATHFKAGMDPSRFMADHVIQTRTSTTVRSSHRVPDPSVRNDRPKEHYLPGTTVIEHADPYAFRPPTVYPPRYVTKTVVAHTTTSHNLLAAKRREILGD